MGRLAVYDGVPVIFAFPLGLLYFRAAEAGDDYGALMAATLIITLPLVTAFLLAQKRFVEGITMTGLSAKVSRKRRRVARAISSSTQKQLLS